MRMLSASNGMVRAALDYQAVLFNYEFDFLHPLVKAIGCFTRAEAKRAFESRPRETIEQHRELLGYNWDIFLRHLRSGLEAASEYHSSEFSEAFAAWLNTFSGGADGAEDIFSYLDAQKRIAHHLAWQYPREIREIGEDFGFHFEREGYEKVGETDRFLVYQVFPTKPGTKVRKDGKPVLVVPPNVLGGDILAFLPGDNRSYTHLFANQGIPTYIRILKDIEGNTAVQTMTLEDDITDTRSFAETIRKRHGRSITLNGYCQGGLLTLANILSGELDGLVDTHVTAVSPIDGSRSKGFARFLGQLPSRFNYLEYGTRILENGNQVVDGDLMSWIYKVKSIDEEGPMVAFYRDLAMLRKLERKGRKISRTATALNYWLTYQRHDLPVETTRISFASYNTPIADDGTMPFTAFGRKLNMNRIKEKGFKWLICYGEDDTLVEKDTALAPLDHIEAEVTPFPKGHVAIAIFWSSPESEYALNTRFGDKGYRGPVRFHLDVEAEENRARSGKKKKEQS
jgi:hypothetical protein